MPGDGEQEICMKVLTLVADLCYRDIVGNENCLYFIYYKRERSQLCFTGTSVYR